MAINAELVHSAVTTAKQVLEAQGRRLDERGNYTRSDIAHTDADEVLARQLELALSDVDGSDVGTLVKLLETVVDPRFKRSFRVVQAALERAQAKANPREDGPRGGRRSSFCP